MASIDKIYGTKEQFDEFYQWCLAHRRSALQCFYSRYWYENEWGTDGKEHPICNFPEKVDKWMLKNCEIGWVVSRIKEQYGLKETNGSGQ